MKRSTHVLILGTVDGSNLIQQGVYHSSRQDIHFVVNALRELNYFTTPSYGYGDVWVEWEDTNSNLIEALYFHSEDYEKVKYVLEAGVDMVM